jgi:hypothetical protein
VEILASRALISINGPVEGLSVGIIATDTLDMVRILYEPCSLIWLWLVLIVFTHVLCLSSQC